MTGENDAPTLCIELRPHPQAHLVGLPSQHLRVYRLHEGVHAIETLWCRAGRQPFEIAVGTRDIAVRAGPDVDDDFATCRHGAMTGLVPVLPKHHHDAVRVANGEVANVIGTRLDRNVDGDPASDDVLVERVHVFDPEEEANTSRRALALG